MREPREALLHRMQAVADACADRVAVREKSREVTYAAFARMVGDCRAKLQARDGAGRTPVGLLLERSVEAYAAMWAAIAEGRAYVPLNPRYPDSRLKSIIEDAGIDSIFTTSTLRDIAGKLGIASDGVLIPDPGGGGSSAGAWSAQHDGGSFAYILYTSGSTGKPKGVPITYDNLLAFIENIMQTIPYPSGSICGQVCELSFDFSVHEIFHALLSGATLCPARPIDLFNPGQFIAQNAISVWISVPSLVRVILANQERQRHDLGSIRLSIFNGEPLTAKLARDWQAAIPDAAVWNTYGPTECTVAVTTQPWEDGLEEIGVVSIGTPLPGCEVALLCDEEIVPLQAATPECTGELLLKTAQCFGGYSDPAIARPFVTDASGGTYYKTGDKALWRDGRVFHLGRLDHQVKIGGHRIELMEVESQYRKALKTDALAVVTYPRQQPTELVLFIEGQGTPPRPSAEALGLPHYMLPKRVIAIEELPVTAHGKLDRIALQSSLEGA